MRAGQSLSITVTSTFASSLVNHEALVLSISLLCRKKKTLQFLRDAIEMRLRMNGEFVSTGRWNEALALKILPPNIPQSLQHLTALVDEIWHHAGDKAVDVSIYSHFIHIK